MTNHLLAMDALGPIRGYGPLSDNAQVSYTSAFNQFSALISNVIGLLSVLGALWFLYQIILSAMQWIGGGGDKQTIDTAKKRMTYAVLGLLILVIAYALIGIIGNFLGINIYNFSGAITNLHP